MDCTTNHDAREPWRMRTPLPPQQGTFATAVPWPLPFYTLYSWQMDLVPGFDYWAANIDYPGIRVLQGGAPMRRVEGRWLN